jgi:hypothetical protein
VAIKQQMMMSNLFMAYPLWPDVKEILLDISSVLVVGCWKKRANKNRAA